MGGHCSSTHRAREEYQLVAETNDHVFKQMQLLNNEHTQQKVGVKEFAFDSKIELENYEDDVELARSYDGIPTLVHMLKYERLDSTQSYYQARLVFEYHPKSLKQ